MQCRLQHSHILLLIALSVGTSNAGDGKIINCMRSVSQNVRQSRFFLFIIISYLIIILLFYRENI